MGRDGAASVGHARTSSRRIPSPSWSEGGIHASSVMVARCARPSLPPSRAKKLRCAARAPPSCSGSTEGRSVTKCSTPRSARNCMASAAKKGGCVPDHRWCGVSSGGRVRKITARSGGSLGDDVRCHACARLAHVMIWSSPFCVGCRWSRRAGRSVSGATRSIRRSRSLTCAAHSVWVPAL